MVYYRVILSVCTLALLLLSACTTSSTGRNQITLFSSAELDKMGTSSFEEMKKHEKISQDKALNSYVQCVAASITKNVPDSVHQGDWEVVLFDSIQINAFALPGGKIGVYTGILSVAENQAQLAAIIGHEVGHVIENHSNERLSSSSLAQTGLAVAGALLETGEIAHQQEWMAGLGLGLQYGILMPYSRIHESEADIVGQELMAKSGFEPKQSVKLWQNMAKVGGKQPPEILSTHPSNSSRIKALTEHLMVSEPIYHQQSYRPNCIKPSKKP